MKFNLSSTLFASLVLLVGTAAAAPVVGDDTGYLNVEKRAFGPIADAYGHITATYDPEPTVTPAAAGPEAFTGYPTPKVSVIAK